MSWLARGVRHVAIVVAVACGGKTADSGDGTDGLINAEPATDPHDARSEPSKGDVSRLQEACRDVCADDGAWCVIGDESAAECTGNCVTDLQGRDTACLEAYVPLLSCMEDVLADVGCSHYVIRHLMSTCAGEVEAFLAVCEITQHSLSQAVRPTLSCRGDAAIEKAADGCRIDISDCEDGNDYAVQCALRSTSDLRCSCFIGSEEVRTFFSGGANVGDFCTDDIGLDYCEFPFLDTTSEHR